MSNLILKSRNKSSSTKHSRRSNERESRTSIRSNDEYYDNVHYYNNNNTNHSSNSNTKNRGYHLQNEETYDNLNLKLQLMVQYEKNVRSELDSINENKNIKKKHIKELKEEIKRCENKEEACLRKLDELKMNRLIIQSRMEEFHN